MDYHTLDDNVEDDNFNNEENAPNIKKFIAIRMQHAKVECLLLCI